MQVPTTNALPDVHVRLHGCPHHLQVDAGVGALQPSPLHHQHHDLDGAWFGTRRWTQSLRGTIAPATDLACGGRPMRAMDVSAAHTGACLSRSDLTLTQNSTLYLMASIPDNILEDEFNTHEIELR